MVTKAVDTQRQIAVEMVRTDNLKFAPFNPPIRTSSKAVKELKKEIEKAGGILVPIVITTDDYVADGNRRLTVAKELNYDVIPAIRVDLCLEELWSILNGGNMSVTQKHWMQTVRYGMSLMYVQERKRPSIENLLRVVGVEEFQSITDEGRGPAIVDIAQSVARYCGHPDDEFVHKVINWFREYGTLRDAKYAVSTKCPPNVLVKAIETGGQIRQSWEVFS